MEIFDLPADKKSRVFLITLLSIAGALILILAIGTIIGLARPRHAGPLVVFGGESARQQTVQNQRQTEDIRVFSGLGRLRIPLADSSILILSIAFPYPAHDITFSEELAAKIGDLRTITVDYFSALPVENPAQIDEEAAKQEILRRFNANLRLGRIETLYFSDMTALDTSF